LPLGHNFFWIPGFAGAAVIAGKGARQVAVFFIKIELKNSAAIAQVSFDMGKIIVLAAKLFFSKMALSALIPEHPLLRGQNGQNDFLYE
jgi:hypothetical protein